MDAPYTLRLPRSVRLAQRRSVGRWTPQGIGQRRRTRARATAILALLTARFTALLRWRHAARAHPLATISVAVYGGFIALWFFNHGRESIR